MQTDSSVWLLVVLVGRDLAKLLPPTTDIYNYIYDGKGGGRLDNVIRFYKSWVLKSVRAVTKYTVSEKQRCL